MLARLFFYFLLISLLLGSIACSRQRDMAAEAEQEEAPLQDTVAENEAPFVTAVEDERDMEALIAAMEQEYRHRTNKALEHLMQAQIFVEEGMPGIALYEINLSLAILETADGLAYKGSVLFLLNRIEEAITFWEKAYDINPDAIHINLPGIPEAFGAQGE